VFKKKIVTVSSQNFFDQCANTIMLTVETDVQYAGLVTNFIWPYLHQFLNDFYGLNGTRKPLKRPFY